MKLHAFTLPVETYRCIDVSNSFISAHHGFFLGGLLQDDYILMHIITKVTDIYQHVCRCHID